MGPNPLNEFDANVREAVEKALAPNRRVLHVFRPSEETANKASKTCFALCLFPCFWPHMILCSPCLISSTFALKARIENTLYVVTDQEVMAIVMDYSNPGCGCLSTGTDSRTLPFSSIISVDVNEVGKSCSASCAVPVLRFTSANVTTPVDDWYVNEPHKARRAVQLAMSNASMGNHNNHSNTTNINTHEMDIPIAVASAAVVPVVAVIGDRGTSALADKRIFVASEDEPGEFQIVNVPDGASEVVAWKVLQDATRRLYPSLGSGPISFKLADVNVPVPKTTMLRENDKIVATRK